MGIHIHIHHHTVDEKLIIKKLDLLMALNQQQFNAMVDRLNTITDDIAADYAKLLAEIAAGNITDESVAAATARLAQLEALGASVENPVPDPVP